jgi:hypothetical protein
MAAVKRNGCANSNKALTCAFALCCRRVHDYLVAACDKSVATLRAGFGTTIWRLNNPD